MKLLTFIFMVLFIPTALFGGVNLKNGNFYISYSDIKVPGGGHDLEVLRTYNSKSAHKGWFGFGWGSDFETYLVVSADGSVVIHENGAGAQTRFIRKGSVDAKAAAKKIVSAMRKRTKIGDKVVNDLVDKLSKDAELRRAYSKKFNVKSTIPKGTKLYSNIRGIQTLEKISSGYKRTYNEGKSEYYNMSGKLTKIVDKNGYKITLNYKKGGNLKSVKDSGAKQLFFSWYPDGKVKNIWSAGDKKAEYKFSGNDLAESKDVEGNVYKFSYDNNHNMTKIAYQDRSSMDISYDRKMQFISKIKSRSGNITKYDYGSNPKNPHFHYWTSVTKKRQGRKSSTNKYEYEIKLKNDGSQYTYRIVTEVNGIKTETVYNECCSLPIKITRGKHVTNFEYNKKGLLLKKISSKGEFVKLSYHHKLNKITKVVNNDGWTNFDYDKKGNLSKAKNSKGKSVLLIYDSRGRITKMIDQNKIDKKRRTLTFKYNALGKPVEIAMQKKGKINVSYDNYGEIKKVESKSGHKMAIQVTQAFQSLLSIVKPAGVNLNM